MKLKDKLLRWGKRAAIGDLIPQLLLFWFCALLSPLVQAAPQLEHVRPDFYSIEVNSSDAADRERIVQIWAHVNSQGGSYRALMPGNTIRGPKSDVQFKWSPGSTRAGSSERLELEWRWSDAPNWNRVLISEGFRSPVNGFLLTPAVSINWGERTFGQVQLRFLILGTDGQSRMDAPESPIVHLNVAPERPAARLRFTEQWQVYQLGSLIAGQSFELDYAVSRISAQIREMLKEDTNLLRIFAHVQFDDDKTLTYPLTAIHSELPVRCVPIMPTVQIPPSARLMKIWFSASYRSRDYFDSNFGENYWFVIKPL